jgi:hypothetical protein
MHATGWQCQITDHSLTLQGVVMSIIEEHNEGFLLHLRLEQGQPLQQLGPALVQLD